MSPNMRLSSKQGKNTGDFGLWLTNYFKDTLSYQKFQVYYDHGDSTKEANVVATKGFIGENVTNLNRLTDIDVMIVSPNGSVSLLIEIEERYASPKKILGDVLAGLICNRFAIRLNGKQHDFSVTASTKLIVAGIVPTSGIRLEKVERTMLPRIQQLSGLSDGLNPRNVEFIFSENIQTTIEKLQNIIKNFYPQC